MSITPITDIKEYQRIITSEIAFIDYYAQWCGPCKQIAPKLPALAAQYPSIKFYKLDVDEFEEIAEECTSLPTFKIFVNGNTKKVVVGINIDKIRAALDEICEIEGFATGNAAAAASPAPASTPAETQATEQTTVSSTSPTTNPNCGKIIQLTSEIEFDKFIQQDFAIIDFYAQWCAPCKQFAPHFKAMAEQYPQIGFAKVDFDELEDLAEKYDVASLPTFVFFKQGKKVHVHIGVSKEKFSAAILDKFQLQ